MGDPAGIGPELALRAWTARVETGCPNFVLIADPELMAQRASDIGIHVPICAVRSACETTTVFSDALPVLPLPANRSQVSAGVPVPSYAASVIAAIDMAVALALSGEVAAVVTNPIAKSVLIEAGFGFPGHTEYLGALAQQSGRTATPVMMLVGGGLRTVPVTVHIPLREVPATLTAEKIITAAKVTREALVKDFGIGAPCLAMTGLNPHAGESGAMGNEERDIIIPAITALNQDGIHITGPLPADTAFYAEARARYDGILAMYHDQALIPVKTLAFDEGVNVTLGLPFVRTSPDHGTAFDIAGTGKARPHSLISALKLAMEMAGTRRTHSEAPA